MDKDARIAELEKACNLVLTHKDNPSLIGALAYMMQVMGRDTYHVEVQ